MLPEYALTIDEFLVGVEDMLAKFKQQMATYPEITKLSWEEWVEQLLCFWGV